MTTAKLAIRYFKDKVESKGYKLLILKDKTRNINNLYPGRDTCGGFHWKSIKVIVIYITRMERTRVLNPTFNGKTATEFLIKVLLHEYCHLVQYAKYDKAKISRLRTDSSSKTTLERQADKYANMHYNRVRKFLDKAGVS